MKTKKILLFHSWGLGDTIMLTPTLIALSKKYELDVLTTTDINKTLIGAVKTINHIHTKKDFLSLLRFCFSSYAKYETLVVSTGINKSKSKLLQYLIGAKTCVTSISEHNKHRIQTNLDAVASLIDSPVCAKVVLPLVSLQNKYNYFDSKRINIGFSVGSKLSQKYKRWKIHKFIQLAKSLQNANVVFFIGPDEQKEKEHILASGLNIIECSLLDTIAYIQQLDILIGTDNGLMHIGYAADITTFTIFGMTNPKEIGGYNSKNYVISKKLNCQPCLDSKNNRLCKELSCLRDLSVDDVLDYINIKGVL